MIVLTKKFPWFKVIQGGYVVWNPPSMSPPNGVHVLVAYRVKKGGSGEWSDPLIRTGKHMTYVWAGVKEGTCVSGQTIEVTEQHSSSQWLVSGQLIHGDGINDEVLGWAKLPHPPR